MLFGAGRVGFVRVYFFLNVYLSSLFLSHVFFFPEVGFLIILLCASAFCCVLLSTLLNFIVNICHLMLTYFIFPMITEILVLLQKTVLLWDMKKSQITLPLDQLPELFLLVYLRLGMIILFSKC